MTLQLLCDRALELHRKGALAEAESLYAEVLKIDPDNFTALHMLGVIRIRLGRSLEAAGFIGAALRINPQAADALSNYGIALLGLGRFEEALASYDRVLGVRPGFAEALNNRGLVLWNLCRWEDALASYDRALAIRPDYAEALSNRGDTLRELGRLHEALASYERAIALDPGYASAQMGKSYCLLSMGRLAEGFRLYEWRRRLPQPVADRNFPQPLWSGQPLAAKTLFIHWEQGLGDTIQFCRYAALAAARGARVILSVQDVLARLMKSLGPAVEIICAGDVPPAFDFHIPLLSMPHVFATQMNDIPAAASYLRAEPERVKEWSGIKKDGFKVGICWQGNKLAKADLGRSFALSFLKPLSEIPGVRLISLQKNDGVEQLAQLPPGMKVEIPGADFDRGDFADTAALMENLDLVVTSDTAAAHLAGALGRPAWVALKHGADWRWLSDRPDCPWYPSLRLFRQERPGDWAGVFARMRTALDEAKSAAK